MADPVESATNAASESIFSFDIACPQCEYNLRGLTVCRCPECGMMLEPHLLAANQKMAKPSPPVWWTLVNSLCHPTRLWDIPPVKESDGPSGGYLTLVLMLAGLPCGAFVAGLMVPNESITLPSLTWGVILAGVAGLIAAVSMFIHMGLCLLALPRKVPTAASAGAPFIIGYSVVWVVPAVTGLVAAHPLMMRLPPSSETAAAEGVMLVACVLWATSLYTGTMAVTHGRQLCSLWCALTNPFWYFAAWALWNVP